MKQKLIISLLISTSLSFPIFANCKLLLGALGDTTLQDRAKSQIEKICSAAEQCHDPATRRVLENYLAASQIYHPSKEEGEMKAFIMRLNSAHHNHPVVEDHFGNFVIRIPGKGSGANKGSLALQTHLDMIIDTKEGTRDPIKNNGISFEIQNGKLVSQGQGSSIGADALIYVSMMLRYLTEEMGDHPPLELVFTTQEEIGLLGAKNFGIKLNSTRLINLDGEEFGIVDTGSMGLKNLLWKFNLPKAPKTSGSRSFHLNITGLKGGHSGSDIVKSRANAVIEGSSLLLQLLTKYPEIAVQLVKSGDVQHQVFALIPKIFDAQILIPDHLVDQVTIDIQRFKSVLLEKYSDESSDQVTISLSPKSSEQNDVIERSSIMSVLSTVSEKIKNGVLSTNPNYTKGILLSSNISFFEVKANDGSKIGIMPRSFENKALEEFSTDLKDLLQSSISDSSLSILAEGPAWTPNLNSELLKALASVAARLDFSLTAEPCLGGLEAAHFAQQGICDIVGFGATLSDVHSTQEALHLDSLPKMIHLLTELVKELSK